MPNNVHNNFAQEASNYFDALATQSTLIDYNGSSGNYREMGMDEIIAEGSNLNFNGAFGMIYEPIDVRISGKNINDARATAGIALWFVKFAPKDDFAARKAVEEEAFRLANKFLAKIKLDQEKYASGEDSNAVFKNLELSTARLEKTGKIGDEHYGYILDFEVFNDGAIAHDTDAWTE